jgi:hypothetical protein
VLLLSTMTVGDVTSIIEERIGKSLREKMEAQSGAIDLLPSYEAIRKNLASSGQSSMAITRAEEMYTSGIGLLTAGDNKRAQEMFSRAIDLMMKNLGDLRNYDVLADALAHSALANLNAGFELDARKAIKKFAHMRPKAELSEEKYPDKLRKLLDKEQSKIERAGPGKLEISVEPEGARVFIDGVEKGQAPLTVEDVGYGYHYLVVRGPTGGVHAEEIRVRGKGKKQEFAVALEGSGGAVAEKPSEEQQKLPTFYRDLVSKIESGRFDTGIRPNLRELTAQTGAQYVTWVVLYKKGMQYRVVPFVYRSEDQALARLDEVTFNFELSNLVVGIDQVANRMVAAVLEMPSDRIVEAVAIGQPEPKKAPADDGPTEVAAKSAAASGETSTGGAPAGGAAGEDDGERAELPTPGPQDPGVAPGGAGGAPPPGGSSNTWTWIGAGAGALAVVGIVAGSILIFGSNGGNQPSSGFSAEVSW